MTERRAYGTHGMGRDQRRLLSRIISGGGMVEVREITQVRSFLVMPDGTEVQVPIRVFESLVERGLFRPQGDDLGPETPPTVLRYRYRPYAPDGD